MGGEKPVKKMAAVEFDTTSGKWRVAHKVLAQPVLFSSKQDAETFKIALLAEELPKVTWNEADQAFTITHADWDKPVVTKASEEATEIVEKVLGEKGWDGTEAKQRAEELTSTARKEKIMASVEVTAGVKQNVQKAEVNIPGHEGAKQNVQKAEVTGTGGTVTTEEGGIKPLEAGKPGAHSIKFQHLGDLAGKADAMAKQLRSHQGIMKLCSELIEQCGPEAVTKGLELVQEMHKTSKPEPK
jgi:hypothetical protein